jgi:DNA-binding LacI/PurR family transcriptional regulator
MAPRGAPKHPTIHDVAQRAGVSKSLVSLVMRDSPNVSDAKRTAVLAAADELGYRPNAVARSLVRRRSYVLGVMLSDLHNPFFAEVVDGIDDAALQAGYRALINSGARVASREAVAIDTLLQLRADGLILAGPVIDTQKVEAAVRSVPVVLVGRATRSDAVDSVTNDDRMGAELVVDHLVSLGHRRIAHIHAGREAGSRARRTGYQKAMERHGLRRYVREVPGSFTEEGGYRGMNALLANGRVPTAVFVANDLAATGALEALDESGIGVPEEMSVVGYDNVSLAGLRRIGLSTVNQPRREMGRTAVELLLERLEGTRDRARHLVLPPSLVVRDTTAPVAAGH